MDDTDWLVRRLGSLREALLWKVEGLGESEARRPRTPTGTNLAGLVKHCAAIEQGYFAGVIGRPGVEYAWPDEASGPNAEFFLTDEEDLAGIVALYRRVGAATEQTLRELPLDGRHVVPWWGDEPVALREIAVHVIAEVARHAGHADILREQLDGSAGLLARVDNLEVPAEGWVGHVRRLEELAGRFDDETDVYADD